MKENLRRCSCHCQSCGFDLLLVPVEALMQRAFPGGVRAGMVMFTTRCALCGKTMVVEIKTPLDHDKAPAAAQPPAPAPALSSDDSRSLLWASALFGAFLVLVLVLWLLRPAAYLLAP